MGLLEKALQFKHELNNRGKETLIDKIKGPAETDSFESIESDLDETPQAGDDRDLIDVDIDSDELTESDSDEGTVDVDAMTSMDIGKEYRKSDAQRDKSMSVFEEKNQAAERENDNDVVTLDENELELIDDDLPDEDMASNSLSFKGTFKDYIVLFETCRELLHTTELDSFFETLAFLIMGQLGVSSSSLILQKTGESGKWYIAESRGINIQDREVDFNTYSGIMGILAENKTIIDIEDFKDDESMIDEFYKYIAIDTRLLVPLFCKNELAGVIVLGDKITSDLFTEEDIDYLRAVAEISSPHLNSILRYKAKSAESESHEKHLQYIEDIDNIYNGIVQSPDMDTVTSLVQSDFRSMGIECYAVFSNFNNDDRYIPVVYEKEDYLLYGELDFSIRSRSHLITFLKETDSPYAVENFAHSRVVAEIYNENQIANMSMFQLYPLKMGTEIPGFILINRIADIDRKDEIDCKVKRLASIIFPAIVHINVFSATRKKYIDTVETVYRRIDREIEQAKNLNIPVTLILFSIKNYKRYHSLYGVDAARKLFDYFERIIKSRLSEGDFSVRSDRNKALIVLPGKDKKYAVPLANSIKNELVASFKKKEMQLLLTFLTSEYPEDGNNVYSLIDVID